MIVDLLMLLGGIFSLMAAIGLVRFPDLFLRMQAAAKGGTLGAGLLVLACAVFFSDMGTVTKAFLVILFLLLTTPVAAHLIARASYFVGIPLWPGTVRDDLRGHYDTQTHALESNPIESEKDS